MIEIITLHALWGTSIPISKKLLTLASPFLLTSIRMIFAGFVLFIINVIRKKNLFLMGRTMWLYNAQIIFAIYGKYMLRYWGLAYMPALKMAFLLNIAPFITALMAYFALNDRLSGKQWIGLTVGFIGMIPILTTTSKAELRMGELFYISWPELAIIAAVCINAYAMIVSRIVIREYGQSITVSNGIRMLGAGVLSLITLFVIDIPITVTNAWEFVGWLSVLVISSNVICHNLHLSLYKYYTVTFISFTDFLSPLFTALYSWLFLSEALTWQYGASVCIVFLGFYLFYQDELKTIYVT